MSKYLHCDAPDCERAVGPLDEGNEPARDWLLANVSTIGAVDEASLRLTDLLDGRAELAGVIGTFCSWPCYVAWAITQEAQLHANIAAGTRR